MKCDSCDFMNIDKDGGWCYMFQEKPRDCKQYTKPPTVSSSSSADGYIEAGFLIATPEKDKCEFFEVEEQADKYKKTLEHFGYDNVEKTKLFKAASI